MSIKIKTIVIVILVILSILLININSGFMATNTKFSTNSASNQNPKPLASEDFECGPIEVISEPVFGQDNNINWSRDVKIAVKNDKIYAVWTDKTDLFGCGDDLDVFYRYFDGNVWSEIQVISEPVNGKNFCSGNSRSPAIAVENGKIYVIWQDDNNTNNAGFEADTFYRSNLTGSGWEDIQVISEPVTGQNFNTGGEFFAPAIAVENGKIYSIWIDTNNTNNAGTDFDVLFRCNLTGSCWEDIQVISEPVLGMGFNTGVSDYPDMAVEDENIYIIWRDDNDTNGAGTDTDTFFRYNISGAGWGEIQVISEPVKGQNFNDKNTYNPSIAVENGMIYTVWEDANDTNNCGNMERDIFFKCNLSGFAWEPVQVISEPVLGQNFNTAWSYGPEIGVYQGTIHVAWSDGNDTNGAGSLDADIFYRCNLTGASWENTQVISEPIKNNNFNIGECELPDIAIENDIVHIVWEDKNDTYGANIDWDIFYRWIKYPFSNLLLKEPNVTPILGNTSTFFNFTVKYIHKNNIVPTEIKVNISGMNYSMLESDIFDTNFIDGKLYFYNMTNLAIGTHTYQFWASDGLNITSTVIFYNPLVYNTRPIINTQDNLTAIEDTYYEIIYQYEDIDLANVGQTGTWNYSTNATWLSFNSTTAKLFGTPTNDDVGTCWVNISINDTMDMDFTNFTLIVINENDNPIMNTTNIEITYEDELYMVDYNATDIDSMIANQVWSLATNASLWLGIDSTTGIISGIPTNDYVGEYWINVSIDDGDTGLDFTNYTLIVLNVNDRPEIITDDELIANANALYIVDYNASDIDSPLSQFTWSLNTNATWLDLDAGTGVLSGTPLNSDKGWYDVNVTVIDGDGGQAWREFVLTVLIGNYPPKIITDDVLYATVNKLYNVDYEATDVDSPLAQLVWSLNTNATWLIIEKNQGILTGTPKPNDVGWYWVNVKVGDGEGGFGSHNFTLNVYSTANQPPEIITKDNLTAVVNLYYAVDYVATDDYTPVNELRWYLDTNASWLNIGTTTGILSGTPKPGDEGFYRVEISVTDLEEGWDSHNFTMHVLKDGTAGDETIKLSNPTFTPSEGDTDTEFTFSIHYRNTNNKSPTYVQLIISGDIYTMELQPGENATNGVYACTLKLSAGTHSYYFVASDGTATELSEDFTTPDIEKIGDEDTHYKFYRDWLIWIVIIVIVIILILGAILIRVKKNKRAQEEPAKELPTPSAEAPSITATDEHLRPVGSPIVMPTAAATQPQIVPAVTVTSPPPTPLEPMVIGQPEEQLTEEELEE